MRVAIYTLGCKVNQYETQAMEQELQRRGHTLVDFESPADAYIINTCSVTAVSDKKSRQMIRRAKSRNPQAVVAACGCYVQTHTPEAQELGIDLNYNVEIETASVLSKGADTLIEQITVDRDLQRWLTEFVQERIDEGRKWDIRDGILSLGGELFKEKNKDALSVLSLIHI